MKRALVLGASALIILALNQNTVSEVKLSTFIAPSVLWFPPVPSDLDLFLLERLCGPC